MELKQNSLKIKREPSELDRQVIEFVDVLNETDIDYSIVSGYVAILTGRSRGTEDIDIIIPELSKEETEKLISNLYNKGYWCVNTELEDIHDLLSDNLSVRIAKKDQVIPNFELFFPQDQYDISALEGSIEACIDEKPCLNISPIELQIAYKLYLGSQKDLEDALHLYEVFKDSLDMERLKNFVSKMSVGDEFDRLRS